VGEDLPNKIYDVRSESTGCIQDSYILPELAWSPDEKNLVFIERRYDKIRNTNINYNMYLAKLDSPDLNLIQNLSYRGSYLWLSDDNYSPEKMVKLLHDKETETTVDYISLPNSVYPENILSMYLRPDNSVMIVIYEGSEKNEYSLWKMTSVPEVSWEKITDFNKSTYSPPVFGLNYAAICDESKNSIDIIDRKLEVIGNSNHLR
jgi:hypothetical protein